MSSPLSSEETTPPRHRKLARPSVGEIILRILAAAGFVYDAYSHFNLAPTYDGNIGSAISQGTLFRIEAVLAVLAAVGVLFIRSKIVTLLAFLLAAGGLAALLVYRYVNVGEFGPFPNMYENIWYQEKVWSAISMAVAAIACLGLLLMRTRRRN